MTNWKPEGFDWVSLGERVDISADGLGAAKLLRHVLETGDGTVHRMMQSGQSKENVSYYHDKLESVGFRLFYAYEGDHGFTRTYHSKDGMCSLDYYKRNKSFSINLLSLNSKVVKELREHFKNAITPPIQQGYVFAITRGSSKLQLTRIGYAASPLIRENYSKDVIEGYDYVLKDLRSEHPSGRITILDGPPGTGKTHLVRAILTEVQDAMFIIVPPAMVASLGGPELLPLLLETKNAYLKKGPTILLLEDADQCLVPRQADNIASISAILNLGDGIYGSLFDIRILATTNAKKADMDPALTRAGRLSKRIEVGPLNYDDANLIFQRLVPGKGDMPKEIFQEEISMKPSRGQKSVFSLAEVYKAAREAGWVPPVTEDPDLGTFEDEEEVDDDE